MADDGYGGRLATGLTASFFIFIFVLIGADLAADWDTGTSTRHLAAESVVMVLCAVGAAILLRRLRTDRRRLVGLQRDVAAAQERAARWRAEVDDHLRGLVAAIDRQFGRWGLTEAERHVAFLLLRGFSHRDIAGVRRTSERTVREQARAVYQKAGLPNRAALSAFFLEGWLEPPDAD